MKNIYVIVPAALLACAVMASPSWAFRDASWKAHGNYSNEFSAFPSGRASNSNYGYRMVEPSASYRSFSYQPQATDNAVKSQDNAPAAAAPAPSAPVTQSAPVRVYRSFSYQPQQESHREPWHYMKTDPRKYRP